MRRLPHIRRMVLSGLSASPNHGYGIILWAESILPEEPRLSIGSVYGALEVLENEGLIELHEEQTEQGRQRRVMHITPDGTQALNAELGRLQKELQATTFGSPRGSFGEVAG